MNKKLLRLALSLFAVSSFCATGFSAENDPEESVSKEENQEESRTAIQAKFSFKAAVDEEPSEGNQQEEVESTESAE